MDQPVQRYWQLRLKDLKATLEGNHFDVHLVENGDQARSLVLDRLLPQTGAKTLSWGGSMTFIATGLYDALKNSPDYQVIDTYAKDVSKEENLQRRRRALLADAFFTGCNAVTDDGQLVNLDMIGNRVAALSFGPQHVFVLVGRNKYVANLNDAMYRIKNYAAPINTLRLGKKTPCTRTTFCEECKSPDRICNVWTIHEKSFPRGRIKIILINQDLGF